MPRFAPLTPGRALNVTRRVSRASASGDNVSTSKRFQRSAIVCAALRDDQLSRALRTIDTGSLMRGVIENTVPATPASPPSTSSNIETATSAAASDADAFVLQGPEPRKFAVADGELANVLSASGSFITRAVSGALCEGWTPSVVEGECPPGTYTLGEFGGRYLKETSDVGMFPRPEITLELYEFEVVLSVARYARRSCGWTWTSSSIPVRRAGQHIVSSSSLMVASPSSVLG